MVKTVTFWTVVADMITMEALSFFLGRKSGLPVWKRILVPILLALSGAGGVKLMYFIENGDFGGISFFGFIFFSPLLMIAIAPLMKMRIGDMLDMIAPLECMALSLHKIDCFITGCCRGIVLKIAEDGTKIRFPSQLTECAVGLVLTGILFLLVYNGSRKDRVFFIYMVAYGLCRYGLNWLRETEPAIWFLPFGTIWSVLCVLIGVIVLLILRYIRSHPKADKEKAL